MAGRRGRVRAQEPPDGVADEVPDAVPADVARTIVLRSLNQAPRTRKQLADLLAKRLVPDDVAVAVLDRFVEVGLINDRDYADNWVRSRHRVRGLTRRVLRQELRQRGVSDVDIESALEQIGEDDEFRAAMDLTERKLRGMGGYDESVQRRRLMGMLMRKGYGGSVATAAISEVLASTGSAEETWT